MSIVNIKPNTPPLTIEEMFKNATLKSLPDQRVATLTLKNLIHSISSSSYELSAQGYEEIYQDVHMLNKTLENQDSKKWRNKQYLIDHALDLAAGKLSLEARKEIRNQHYGRDDILYPGEIITDRKAVRYRDIKFLAAKLHEVEKKIKRYKQQLRNMKNSDEAVHQNYVRNRQLDAYLKQVIAGINKAFKDLEGSSYLHNKNKLNMLNQLSNTASDFYYSLKKMRR